MLSIIMITNIIIYLFKEFRSLEGEPPQGFFIALNPKLN